MKNADRLHLHSDREACFFSQRSQVLILYWGCMFPMHIRLVLGTDLLAAFLKNSLNDLDSGLRPFRPQVCVIVQC